VDNSANTADAVAWTLSNGALLEAGTIPATAVIPVIDTEGPT
jgi:hypothetical protein